MDMCYTLGEYVYFLIIWFQPCHVTYIYTPYIHDHSAQLTWFDVTVSEVKYLISEPF